MALPKQDNFLFNPPQINKKTTCPECKYSIPDPVKLPCDHHFCLICTFAHFSDHGNRPICGREICDLLPTEVERLCANYNFDAVQLRTAYHLFCRTFNEMDWENVLAKERGEGTEYIDSIDTACDVGVRLESIVDVNERSLCHTAMAGALFIYNDILKKHADENATSATACRENCCLMIEAIIETLRYAGSTRGGQAQPLTLGMLWGQLMRGIRTRFESAGRPLPRYSRPVREHSDTSFRVWIVVLLDYIALMVFEDLAASNTREGESELGARCQAKEGDPLGWPDDDRSLFSFFHDNEGDWNSIEEWGPTPHREEGP